jgi:hypothetical protein
MRTGNHRSAIVIISCGLPGISSSLFVRAKRWHSRLTLSSSVDLIVLYLDDAA